MSSRLHQACQFCFLSLSSSSLHSHHQHSASDSGHCSSGPCWEPSEWSPSSSPCPLFAVVRGFPAVLSPRGTCPHPPPALHLPRALAARTVGVVLPWLPVWPPCPPVSSPSFGLLARNTELLTFLTGHVFLGLLPLSVDQRGGRALLRVGISWGSLKVLPGCCSRFRDFIGVECDPGLRMS